MQVSAIGATVPGPALKGARKRTDQGGTP